MTHGRGGASSGSSSVVDKTIKSLSHSAGSGQFVCRPDDAIFPRRYDVTNFIRIDVTDSIAKMTLNSPVACKAVVNDAQYGSIETVCHHVKPG